MAEPLPAGWTEHQDPNTGNNFYSNTTTGQTTWERPKAALPDGWAEHVDPQTGRTFFYKAATGETSWERPGAPAAVADALPEGWTEHKDEGSGRTFYYKAATGETSWEKPGASAAAASASPVATASALPEGWAEHVDPNTNRTFYYKAATGETSWERPGGAAALPKGTWSTQQAQDLQKFPNPPVDTLPQRGVEIFSTATSGTWSSVSRVIDALNDGTLTCQTGVGVLFSASKDSYWLIWRSDKEKEADAIKALYGC